MQAATMFQEDGEFARAGDLFFQAGFYAEAAENFSLVNDLARAAAAYERAGNYLQAAQAYESVGGDKEKLATLYEKGGDFYPAGRLFVKLGQLDRALNVLQQVDPASPNYPSASLLVGMIFLKRGLADLAREKFLKIIDNQPVGKANLEPYYFLALCHEHAGEAENARIHLLENPRRGLQLPGREKAAGTEVAPRSERRVRISVRPTDQKAMVCSPALGRAEAEPSGGRPEPGRQHITRR